MLHDITVAQTKVFAMTAASSLINIAAGSAASFVPGAGGFVGSVMNGITQSVIGEVSKLITNAVANNFEISGDGIISFLITQNKTKSSLISKLESQKDSFERLIKVTIPLISDSEIKNTLNYESNLFITRKLALEGEVAEGKVEKRIEQRVQKKATSILKAAVKKPAESESDETAALNEKIQRLEERIESLEKRFSSGT